MNEKKLLKDINEFEDKLKKQLNEKILKSIECYIFESNWKNNPLNHLIYNFSMAINFLKNNGEICYIGKNLMEQNFNKEEINKFHNIPLIYTENNKIIIDFHENESNQSILIIYPLEKKKYVFIIVLKKNNKDKKEIFESILSEDIIDISDIEKIKIKYSDYLIKFDDYIKNINNNDKNIINLPLSNIKNNEKEIKEILQILILLYYY